MAEDAEKVYFGNVGIWRVYCEVCKMKALVVKGCLQCCGAPVETPETGTVCRESEPPHNRKVSDRTKRKALADQENVCFYCFKDLTVVHFDHVAPHSWSEDNRSTNIVASCTTCNRRKSDKMFDDVGVLRTYLEKKRRKDA